MGEKEEVNEWENKVISIKTIYTFEWIITPTHHKVIYLIKCETYISHSPCDSHECPTITLYSFFIVIVAFFISHNGLCHLIILFFFLNDLDGIWLHLHALKYHAYQEALGDLNSRQDLLVHSAQVDVFIEK